MKKLLIILCMLTLVACPVKEKQYDYSYDYQDGQDDI
tara:strand:+ start:16752 stop:16862 length:111 start_codon:yes stop_codon:yes gene_type:complete